MLPPNGPGVLVAMASFRAGATPTHPSIGLTGSSMAGVMSGALETLATPRASIEAPRDAPRLAVHTRGNRRRIHRIRRQQAARIGVVAIDRDAVDRHDQQVAWLGAFDVERARSAGSGPEATLRPFQSVPPASTVLVTTRSPGLIRSAGGCAKEKVL